MKRKTSIISLIFLLLVVGTAQAATTSSDTSSADAAALISVSSVTIDPEVFYPFEEGTITITLTNLGTTSVGLSNPTILSDKIHIVNKDTWNTMSYIGAGSTLTYSFLITADPPDGTYYPLFSVATKDSNSIHYPLVIKVDSDEIKSSISKKPDNFSIGATSKVNVSIINPRAGAITSIIITPICDGVEVSPQQKFVSSLSGESEIEIPFEITPETDASNVTFHISYQNGDNEHTSDVVLPLNIGEDKMAAVPIVNNVELTSSGSYYTLTGDVSNAGLTDAKSMIVTVGSPATAVAPYSEYAIGSLAADDFSSFEISFSCTDLSSVPLKISWKDSDGDSFCVTKALNLNSNSMGTSTGTSTGSSSGTASTGSSGPGGMGGPSGGGGMSLFGNGGNAGLSTYYPLIAVGILGVIGIVGYTKRKWILSKLKKQ